MNTFKAKQIIVDLLEKHADPADQGEFEAVATHWLQNPAYCPPLMPNGVYEELARGFPETYTEIDNENSVRETCVPYQTRMPFVFEEIPFPPPPSPRFRFIDLFAGIGGFRIAFQNLGNQCVFSCEWDRFAKQTYEANFGEVPYGDIRNINKREIPQHDILCAGFPCQPFSLAGVSKKNSLGRKHGFADEAQGTLFFELLEILKLHRPPAFFLENVKNLLTHDKKRTFDVIRRSLEEELGYIVNWKIVDGANWVPQHRERLFIVGFDPRQIRIKKSEISIPQYPSESYRRPELRDIVQKQVEGHTLGLGTWETLVRHKKHHAEQGNGFGYGLHKIPIKEGSVTRTISARYHKDGAEILIEQPESRPRRLTVEEAMQLQGYDPRHFLFPVSKTQAYRQIGNSVVVPAIEDTAREIVKILEDRSRWI